MRHKILFILLVTFIVPLSGETRTWYITVAGDGDAPTINAAMDSCSSGDTILIQSGTHILEEPVFSPITLGRLCIMGETSIPSTIIDCSNCSIGFIYSGGVHELRQLIIQNADSAAVNINLCVDGNIEIFNNVIKENNHYGILITQSSCNIIMGKNLIYSNDIGIAAIGSTGIWIYVNTFANHRGTTGAALSFNSCPGYCAIESNIFYDNSNIFNGTPASYSFSCNDLYNNNNGEAPFLGIDKNIGVDPQFCSETPYIDGNFYLQSDSPLLYVNHLDEQCWDIGARVSNCGSVATENTSWGSIKMIQR